MGKKINKVIGQIIRGILEIIYPKESTCIICNESDVEGICYKCKSKITFCKEEELCIGYYKGPLKELILAFKYQKDFSAGEVLVNLIEKKVMNLGNDYYLTFIPISNKSLRERGFNQCEYLAKELGFRNNIKVVDTLEKIRETKIQKTLSKEERAVNLQGAFKVKNGNQVFGNKFLLIDDVITTGATTQEGIRALKENGAKEIKILTLGRSHI
ncbi:ComF family protein [Clostridium vincentii]|uniref:DNA utilization protein GntX n=1 Tax=Clostridium vincentii TaxID=52704 RepID=A0A2T0BH20_9CLOT|nr:ComF family protein [Clostridium vincentii]PRR83133.1 DNA utilization protein GntX [Clostridium vincentii]